jgi:hypothetical protein
MGADINRTTMDNIRNAGWKILYEERLSYDIVRWIEAEPSGNDGHYLSLHQKSFFPTGS